MPRSGARRRRPLSPRLKDVAVTNQSTVVTSRRRQRTAEDVDGLAADGDEEDVAGRRHCRREDCLAARFPTVGPLNGTMTLFKDGARGTLLVATRTEHWWIGGWLTAATGLVASDGNSDPGIWPARDSPHANASLTIIHIPRRCTSGCRHERLGDEG